MNEAPKKIWEAPKKIWIDAELAVNDVPYIRADIVDELVEALKDVMDAYSDRVKELSYKQGILVGDSRIAHARAALAKLEEEQ